MSEKLVEGLWDCPYCGAKQIGGLTKYCPQCGHPQDAGTKFYMGESIHYLDEEVAAQYGQGADWVCEYCGGLNRHHFKYCSNCGAEKEASKTDYFTSKEEKHDAGTEFVKQNYDNVTRSGPGARRFLTLGLALLAMILIFNTCFGNRKKDAYVSDKGWERFVTIEEEGPVVEKGWEVPDGAKLISQEDAVHHYEEVVDHYETKSKEVSEQVFDHYEPYYVDNGDGTFTEQMEPKYRFETHTEYYEEPVYVKQPVYATEYTYEIIKWIEARTERSSGTTEDPYWPTVRLAGDNERNGREYGKYMITITVPDKKGDQTYLVEVSEDEFANLKVDDSLDVTIKNKQIATYKKK